jgi:hypothetical protein
MTAQPASTNIPSVVIDGLLRTLDELGAKHARVVDAAERARTSASELEELEEDAARAYSAAVEYVTSLGVDITSVTRRLDGVAAVLRSERAEGGRFGSVERRDLDVLGPDFPRG